jgi:hypothetical protein
MNHLLSGTALAAALVIAAPVWAQTPMTPSSRTPAATAPTAAPEAPMATKAHHKRMHQHATAQRGKKARGASSSDNMANQLNAQEVARNSGGGIGGAPAPAYGGGMGGAPAPAYGGPRTAPYGQPNQLYGIPGAAQPSPSGPSR